jgi:hypothetical protein
VIHPRRRHDPRHSTEPAVTHHCGLVVRARRTVMVLPIVMSSPDAWEPASWASVHASELPQSVIDIKAFPVAYRRAIIRALPVETQASLWRDHLASYLNDAAALTAAQKELVAEAMAFCTPDGFARRAELKPVVKDLEEKAKVEFSGSMLTEIFVSFGPQRPVQVTRQVSALRISLVAWLRRSFHPSAQEVDCGCSAYSDFCSGSGAINPEEPTGQKCYGSSTCSSSSWGCGFMWWYGCDGMCREPIEGGLKP